MRTTTTTIASVLLVASTAYAQSLSDGCTQAFANVASNPDASECLRPNSLIQLASTNSSESIVGPVNSWLTDLCGAPACSNDTLSAVVQNITSGCSTELKLLGLSSDDSGTITTYVQEYYPTVREVVCLKESNDLCVTKTLNDLQGSAGTLSIDNIGNIISSTTSDPTNLSNISCTNCLKEAYNIVHEKYPDVISETAVQETCGNNFTDGQTPQGVTQTASTATAGGNGDDTDAAIVVSSFKTFVQAIAGLSATVVLLA